MRKNVTSSEEIQEKRYRHFMILLYPEWDNYDSILQDIKGSFKNWAYITHNPEEEEKKEHTHVILSIDNPRSIESLAKRLEIPIRFCDRIKSLRGACRYLIHKDNDDKIQYELTEVKVSNSFKSTFFRSFDDLESDDDILSNIFVFIDEHTFLNSIQLEVELSKFVCHCAYDRVFKRYYSSIVKYINFKCKN